MENREHVSHGTFWNGVSLPVSFRHLLLQQHTLEHCLSLLICKMGRVSQPPANNSSCKEPEEDRTALPGGAPRSCSASPQQVPWTRSLLSRSSPMSTSVVSKFPTLAPHRQDPQGHPCSHLCVSGDFFRADAAQPTSRLAHSAPPDPEVGG